MSSMTTEALAAGCIEVRNATTTAAVVDMAAAVHIGFSAREEDGRFIEDM